MKNLIAYYENYDEEGRLARSNAHMTEYLTSIHYFTRYSLKTAITLMYALVQEDDVAEGALLPVK